MTYAQLAGSGSFFSYLKIPPSYDKYVLLVYDCPPSCDNYVLLVYDLPPSFDKYVLLVYGLEASTSPISF